MILRSFHCYLGLLALAAFLYTGLHLQFGLSDLPGSQELVRSLYRANHIYVLFASLVNLSLGCYLSSNPIRWRRVFQVLGSLLVLASPMILLFAFFHDPPRGELERTFTAAGVLSLTIGVLCHVAGAPGRAVRCS